MPVLDSSAKVEESDTVAPVDVSADEEAVASIGEANLSNEQKDDDALTREEMNIENSPGDILMSVSPKGDGEGDSEPVSKVELPIETSAGDVVAANKEYYDRVDQFRSENKDMSFSQRMSKLTGAKTPEERAKYVSDWIYESDKVLNNVLGPGWADLKQSFREDSSAFGRLADAIVKEYGDPEHENPPFEELPRLLFQSIHPTSKNFTQWLRSALGGKRGMDPTKKKKRTISGVPEFASAVKKIEPLDVVVTKPRKMVKTKAPQPQSKNKIAVVKSPAVKKSAKAPITGSPLERVLAHELAVTNKPMSDRAKSRDLPREHKGPLITDFIRDKIIKAIKNTKKNVVSMSSLGGDFFSPKKRAEDIAKALGESWIKIDKPSLSIASEGKDKLGMKRGDAYNYMFELSVNVLRNERISKREKDKMRDKLNKFSEIHREAVGLEPLGEANMEGVTRTTGKPKSQKHVDDFVVGFVRELEMIINRPRFFELGVF